MSEFDSIATKYRTTNSHRPLFEYAVYPSFFRECGNLNDLRALDLACGEGFVARELKKRGAREVIGIDESKEMIRLAKDTEKKEKSRIQYYKDVVGKLKNIGSFDIVTGSFLLHYSKSKNELINMCRDCYDNLSSGGLFLAINNNPEHPLSKDRKYENLISCNNNPPKEGDKLEVNHTILGNEIHFANYYWKKKTYEMALKKAGFYEVEWLPIEIEREGYKKMGKDFWKEFQESPFFTIIKCRK